MTDVPNTDHRSVSEGFALRDEAQLQLLSGDILSAVRMYLAAAARFDADGYRSEAFSAAVFAMTNYQNGLDMARLDDRYQDPRSGRPRLAELSNDEIVRIYEAFFNAGEQLATEYESRADLIRSLLAERSVQFRSVMPESDRDASRWEDRFALLGEPRAVSEGFALSEEAQHALLDGDISAAVRTYVAAAYQFWADGRLDDAFSAAAFALTNMENGGAFAAVDERFRDPRTGTPKVASLSEDDVSAVFECFFNVGELVATNAERQATVVRDILAVRSADFGRLTQQMGIDDGFGR